MSLLLLFNGARAAANFPSTYLSRPQAATVAPAPGGFTALWTLPTGTVQPVQGASTVLSVRAPSATALTSQPDGTSLQGGARASILGRPTGGEPHLPPPADATDLVSGDGRTILEA